MKDHKEIMKKGLLIGVGLATIAQEKTQKLANELVRKGKINKTEGKKLVKNIWETLQQ